jgi:hypothetical protein
MTNEEAVALIKENPDNFIKLMDIEEYGFDLENSARVYRERVLII